MTRGINIWAIEQALHCILRLIDSSTRPCEAERRCHRQTEQALSTVVMYCTYAYISYISGNLPQIGIIDLIWKTTCRTCTT